MAVDLKETRVRDWMEASLPVVTPRTNVATALRLLREHRIPALPVCDAERFVGLIDEKALLRLTPSEATTLDIYELREVLDKMTVGRAMAMPAATAAPEMRLDEAAALMRRGSADVIPVLDSGRFVGLLHWTALLAAAVGETPCACGR
jgi:acetoin utilization protein AcuB